MEVLIGPGDQPSISSTTPLSRPFPLVQPIPSVQSYILPTLPVSRFLT